MPKDKNDLCPIFTAAKLGKEGGEHGFSVKCREGQCRWWCETEDACCEKVNALANKALADKP
jgi:hypothetical protein